ncbi:MAG: S-adenosylmethionine decarboxylase proenzyme [Candidatus Omnitrophica bacterium CG1_02_49_10]|nr:MAG: S-adenosylmethionine decarboxylase proenzyme [Candidatus Omnitrophica bacterium CG1_02_49_10]
MIGTESKEKESVFATCEHFNFAGTHLLLEFWQAQNLNDVKTIEEAMVRAVEACGATLLDIKLHHFSPQGGVTGVAILAESHISIHTWPEFEYAAIDIFVCGKVEPYPALPVFREALKPGKIQVMDIKRGIFG